MATIPNRAFSRKMTMMMDHVLWERDSRTNIHKVIERIEETNDPTSIGVMSLDMYRYLKYKCTCQEV